MVSTFTFHNIDPGTKLINSIHEYFFSIFITPINYSQFLKKVKAQCRSKTQTLCRLYGTMIVIWPAPSDRRPASTAAPLHLSATALHISTSLSFVGPFMSVICFIVCQMITLFVASKIWKHDVGICLNLFNGDCNFLIIDITSFFSGSVTGNNLLNEN